MKTIIFGAILCSVYCFTIENIAAKDKHGSCKTITQYKIDSLTYRIAKKTHTDQWYFNNAHLLITFYFNEPDDWSDFVFEVKDLNTTKNGEVIDYGKQIVKAIKEYSVLDCRIAEEKQRYKAGYGERSFAIVIKPMKKKQINKLKNR